ncbi:M18 family aminopeptidase [Veillonella criceti]|uniref:M18 family aminopeptidase n=1 Tax=Veillonella criceti TaxID=103891 RepID=A0A380NI62_9FIRM|nr:M18 family aminopeptidase [Veillonella criceti]SUP40280.1 Probable M18 family aminopeptidase 2 [Veillonella criceti]
MNTVARLLEYIDNSTSPYHTVKASADLLKAKGFKELQLDELWAFSEGDYFVKVYDTTLIAFHVGTNLRDSLRIVSAHTDFPALRVKPNPLIEAKGYGKLNVETYGGLILNTWLDRPLSMAGVVVTRSEDPFHPEIHYVDIARPLLTIPNLAIHMNRNINDGVALDKQLHMLPLFMMANETEAINDEWLIFLSEQVKRPAEDILSYELTLYPVEGGTTFGRYDEFISSPRIDNLTSCMACLEGILEAQQVEAEGLRLIALFDNEEVGSRTKQGGASTILSQLVERIYMATGHTKAECYADIAGGFMLSADVAHGYHPNYPEKNDMTNVPVLNQGLVLKVAASQSYAGDAWAMATVKALCETNDIPYQIYVNRSNIPGGSTVGSISSAMLTMRTMDVGVPILAMHSARETMGANDQEALEHLMRAFLR